MKTLCINWMDRFFRLAENGSSIRTEVVGGATTFLTMAYIIFVQPAVLSGAMFGMTTGLDFGSVMAATCVSAAVTTILMGLYARYPIALAPGMGENFFFVFSLLPAAAALPIVQSGQVKAWEVGLGVILISGILFLAVSLSGLRRRIVDGISPSLKNAVAAGIGLFIAFIGLQNAGVIVKDPGTAVKLNPHFASPDLIVFFFGLVLASVLYARRVRGSILLAILASAVLSAILHALLPLSPWANLPIVKDSALMKMFTPLNGVVSAPPSMAPTFLKADVWGALIWPMAPFIAIFFFMDMFDTIGTMVGVCEQGKFMKDNKLPRADRVLTADAVGTVLGAACGTSTVTSFIESAAGVAQGARTGLANLVTAALFLLALFFGPVISTVGCYPPITAPALVLVGALMLQNVVKVDWNDSTESIPAFLTIVGIPFSYSISDGLALGFISYTALKVLTGRRNEAGWLTIALAIVMLAYFIGIRSGI
ncbi:MAG: NCS2 family permease [Kiritimatiellae bacterium]|nr:NCS2 family permease [Kiritimatiellia bacterium]